MPTINEANKLFKRSRMFYSTESAEEHLDAVKELFKEKEDKITSLKAENERLKSENYKDEELAKMKAKMEQAMQQRKEAYDAMYRGFPISKEEQDDINNWMRAHDITTHGNTKGYHGAIGGGFDYVFTPTSIGTVAKCVCGTCKLKAIAAAMATGTYDRKAYTQYMAEHGGEYCFQDL